MNRKGNTFLRDIASAGYGILGNLFTTTIAFVQCIVAALFWPVDWAGKKLVTQATRPSNSWQLLARPLSFFRTHQIYPVVYGAPFAASASGKGGANSSPILLALQFFAFSISRVLIAVTFRNDCALDPLSYCSSSLDTNQNRIPAHGPHFWHSISFAIVIVIAIAISIIIIIISNVIVMIIVISVFA